MLTHAATPIQRGQNNLTETLHETTSKFSQPLECLEQAAFILFLNCFSYELARFLVKWFLDLCLNSFGRRFGHVWAPCVLPSSGCHRVMVSLKPFRS